MDVISLTKKLLSFNTINPPGNEAEIAQKLGKLLTDNGFVVSLPVYDKNRLHLVAEKGVSGSTPPLVLSGHFDTVPLGEKSWTRDPFTGKIEGDIIYGRSSSDIRSTTMIDHKTILERLIQKVGDDVILETLVNLEPITTLETDPFVQLVYDICGVDRQSDTWPKSLPYVTDGSILQPFYGGVPTIILGPGEPGMAHQTDEYCSVKRIKQSVSIYKNIILNRRK